jgi:hypothetical protein
LARRAAEDNKFLVSRADGGIRYASKVAYWFATPTDRKPSPALKAFQRWLMKQVE